MNYSIEIDPQPLSESRLVTYKIKTYVKILYISTKTVINGALWTLGSAGLAGITLKAPNAAQGFALLLKKSTTRPDNYGRLLVEMKRRGLVHVVNSNDNYTYSLTPAGAYRLQQLMIDDLKIPAPEKWDRHWRMIIFDVPVKQSGRRVSLTQQLQARGFMMLQKSVWVHPFPCFDVVEQIAVHYNLLRYISFLEVERMDNLSVRRLLRHFDHTLKLGK